MPELPISCTLSPEDLERRRRDLLPALVARAVSVEELPEGMRWRFSAADGLLAQIASVIDEERRCCRFLRFELIVDADCGDISLSATGPTGTRDFLSSLVSPPARG